MNSALRMDGAGFRKRHTELKSLEEDLRKRIKAFSINERKRELERDLEHLERERETLEKEIDGIGKKVDNIKVYIIDRRAKLREKISPGIKKKKDQNKEEG